MTLRGHYDANTLEALVCEWRDAQLAIDALSVQERRLNLTPLHRLIAAHNALLTYALEALE